RRKRVEKAVEQLASIQFAIGEAGLRARLAVVEETYAHVERRVRAGKDPSITRTNRGVVRNAQVPRLARERLVRPHVHARRRRARRYAVTGAESRPRLRDGAGCTRAALRAQL